jgi:hypothetical protein
MKSASCGWPGKKPRRNRESRVKRVAVFLPWGQRLLAANVIHFCPPKMRPFHSHTVTGLAARGPLRSLAWLVVCGVDRSQRRSSCAIATCWSIASEENAYALKSDAARWRVMPLVCGAAAGSGPKGPHARRYRVVAAGGERSEPPLTTVKKVLTDRCGCGLLGLDDRKESSHRPLRLRFARARLTQRVHMPCQVQDVGAGASACRWSCVLPVRRALLRPSCGGGRRCRGRR